MDSAKPNRRHVLEGVAFKILLAVASVLGVAAGVVAIDEFAAGSSRECDASAIAAHLKDQGAYAAALWTGDLHGSGVCSIVIVARSLLPHHRKSDEIEIYDPVGGRYARVFAFQPDATPAAGGGAVAPWSFRLDEPPTRAVGATVLLVGAFTQNGEGSPMYPMSIQWLPSRERYTITALLPESPTASKVALSNAHEEVSFAITETVTPKTGTNLPPVSKTRYTRPTQLFLPYARENFTAYTHPVTFRDALGNQTVREYGALRYTFAETEEKTPALLVALAAHYGDTMKQRTTEGHVRGVEPGSGIGPIQAEQLMSIEPDQLELRAWTLSANPQVRLVGCQAYNGVFEGHPVYTVIVPLSRPYSLSGRIWSRYLHSAVCYSK
jgi:hypothetical protein